MAEAAARSAVSSASIDIGPQPAECSIDTPHAPRIVGEELAVILRQERHQLDLANAKRYRCASHYNELRAALRGGN